MHQFPANKLQLANNKVEALVATHDKALADAEAKVKALTALVAKHEEQLARSVLRRVWHWLWTYEGLV